RAVEPGPDAEAGQGDEERAVRGLPSDYLVATPNSTSPPTRTALNHAIRLGPPSSSPRKPKLGSCSRLGGRTKRTERRLPSPAAAAARSKCLTISSLE